jgi:molybdate transport system substrate-binding protein
MSILLRVATVLALAVAATTGSGGGQSARAADAPVIAAASSLRDVMAVLVEKFEEKTGHSVRLSFGSSGNLYRQILQGAPYGLFLSANERYVRLLYEADKVTEPGTVYALGRIVLAARKGSPLDVAGGLDGLARAVADGTVRRFAIANPKFAPYGQRAREALRNAGLWQPLHGKLVVGESVAQTAQFVVSPATEGGIVAYAQAVSPQMKDRIDYVLIPAALHAPLKQSLALTGKADPVATAFRDFVLSAEAGTVFTAMGFAIPSQEK